MLVVSVLKSRPVVIVIVVVVVIVVGSEETISRLRRTLHRVFVFPWLRVVNSKWECFCVQAARGAAEFCDEKNVCGSLHLK